MNNIIKIRRESLAQFSKPIHKGIYITLIEMANEKLEVTLIQSEFIEQMGVTRQEFRTVIQKLMSNGQLVLVGSRPTGNRSQQEVIFRFQKGSNQLPTNYQPITNQLPPTQSNCKSTDYAVQNIASNQLPTNYQPITNQLEQKKSKRKTEPFIKPTLEEMLNYGLTKGGTIEVIEDAWNYYTSNGWKVGRVPMKDWKSALTRWIKNNYGNANSKKGQQASSGRNGQPSPTIEGLASEIFRLNHS